MNVVFKTIVGDRLAHLASAIRIALGRTDIVITMGGLGPTEDDLTRQAVAEALGIRLRRNPEIVGALYARFAARRAQMTENNARQADVLDGSVILENDRGTAPGQWLDTVYGEHRKLVILLPGPPSEVKAMFDAQCMERLRAVFPRRAIATRTLKMAMIGESQADARIAPIYTKYKDVETTILAHTGDITLNLSCAKGNQEAAQARVDELAGKIEEELEEFHLLFAGRVSGADRSLLPGDARGHAGSSGKLHRGPGSSAPHQHQRQFAIVSGRGRGLQRRTQDPLRRGSTVS